jgi:fumarate hydratase class II
MPGKVNPTQPEAVTQVVAQVIGNDATISFAGSQGNFELNVFKPVIIYNLLQSIQIIADASQTFADRCLRDLKANEEKITYYLDQSLMLVTALTPRIGYDQATMVAKEAYEKGKTLKQIILEKELLSESDVNKALDPSKMISP